MTLRKLVLYKITPMVPVIQILLSVYSAYDPLDWFNAKDTIGYSILTSVVYVTLFFFAVHHKYCFIPKYCTLGLILMNLISWLGSSVAYEEFAQVYDTSIIMIVGIIITFIWLNKRKSPRYDRNITRKRSY